MRRSTEKIIAVQFLTLIVAVTGLLLAHLLGDSHRGSAPAHLISWGGMSVSSASPWHSLPRAIRREFGAVGEAPVATVAAEAAARHAENSSAQ